MLNRLNKFKPISKLKLVNVQTYKNLYKTAGNVPRVVSDGMILTFHTTLASADEAQRHCRRHNNSHLVTIRDQRSQDLIAAKIASLPAPVEDFQDFTFFIGYWTAARQNSRRGSWYWSTDNSSLGGDTGFLKWIGYSPALTKFPSCVYVYPRPVLRYLQVEEFNNTSGGWLNKACDMPSYFICEKREFSSVRSQSYVVCFVITVSTNLKHLRV